MKFPNLPHIGMRKVKSAIAVVLSFLIWQIVRIPFPQFEIHPLFGYLYSIGEMRPTAQKTKQFGWWRIKATLIGLCIGFCALPISISYGAYAGNGILYILVDIALFVFGVILALCLAELFKCGNLCGIAAMVFVICLVRDRNANVNIYLYAILRVFETLLGVFSAWVVNNFIDKHTEEKEKNNKKECSNMKNITISNKPTTIEITKYYWADGGYEPKVEITLSHDDNNFYVTFKTHESNPLVEKDTHLMHVCEDSCVEWFANFTPDANGKYFNFEVNAKGIMDASYRVDRYDTEHLKVEDIEMLNIKSEIHEDYWTVSYAVPSELIKKYSPTFDMNKCTYIKSNFYKCGDNTQIPHYGAYFEPNPQVPDFHRPEYFGTLNVE